MSMRAKLRNEDGAAAVEFALIVGLLAILVFGLLEYGLAFWQVQNLRSAAREGARVAAVGGDDADIQAAMAGRLGRLVSAADGRSPVASRRCAFAATPARAKQVTIKINNASLSGAVKEAFEVSIPFLPPITLNPTLSGTFRCEE